MSDPRLTYDHDDRGPGLAPLFASGLASGTGAGVSAALLGAGWPLILASYWLAGTTGLLGAAALACGLLRPPPLPRLRLPAAPLFALAGAPVRRARR